MFHEGIGNGPNNEERKYICGKANEFIKIRKCVLEMLQYIRI